LSVHNPSQPLVDDVIEQLVQTVEQHCRSLNRRLVDAASFVELRDGAIHGGQTLARYVDGFLGYSQYFFHPRSGLHDQEFLIQHCLQELIGALAPCLVLDNIQGTLRCLDWWVRHATCPACHSRFCMRQF